MRSAATCALTGLALGDGHGAGAWPAEWAARIEYGDELRALGAVWDA